MIYVLNIGTITFYYIADLTCIATWPKYTIFGWGCHMELLPTTLKFRAGIQKLRNLIIGDLISFLRSVTFFSKI
jgi:hypothetical protein